MIRDAAAIECARTIISNALPGASEELILLGASLIKRAVQADELRQEVERIEIAQKVVGSI